MDIGETVTFSWIKVDEHLDTFKPKIKKKEQPKFFQLLDLIKVKEKENKEQGLDIFSDEDNELLNNFEEDEDDENDNKGAKIHAGAIDKKLSLLIPMRRGTKLSLDETEEKKTINLKKVSSFSHRKSVLDVDSTLDIQQDDDLQINKGERRKSKRASIMEVLSSSQRRRSTKIKPLDRKGTKFGSQLKLEGLGEQERNSAIINNFIAISTSPKESDSRKLSISPHSPTNIDNPTNNNLIMSEQRLKQEFRKQQNSLKNINNINSNNSEKKQSPLRPKTPPQANLKAKRLWKLIRRKLDINIVLNKDPKDRDEEEIGFLMAFIRTLPFFANSKGEAYTEEMLHDLACDITYQSFKSMEVIFYEGDESDAFYIILSGEVNIVKFVMKSNSFFDVSGRRRSVQQIQNRRTSLQHLFEKDIISTIGPGTTFGQNGLLKNQPRGATVVAKGDCEIVRISKDTYVRIVKSQDQLMLKRRMMFLSCVDIFSHLTNEEMNLMSYFGNEIKYPKGKVLIKEGEDVVLLKLIKSGEVLERRGEIEIAIIGSYGVVGDICLLKLCQKEVKIPCYQNEMLALSQVTVLELHVHDVFNAIRSLSIPYIQKAIEEKHDWRLKRYNDLKNNKIFKIDKYTMNDDVSVEIQHQQQQQQEKEKEKEDGGGNAKNKKYRSPEILEKKGHFKPPPVTLFLPTVTAIESYCVPLESLQPPMMMSNHTINNQELKLLWRKGEYANMYSPKQQGVNGNGKKLSLSQKEMKKDTEKRRVKLSYQLTKFSSRKSSLALAFTDKTISANESSIKSLSRKFGKLYNKDWYNYRKKINNDILPSE